MLKKLICIASIIIVLSGVWLQSAQPVFKGFANEYEVYIGDASSLARIAKVSGRDYPFTKGIKGESCVVDSGVGVLDILESYDATLLFTERTKEGVSYYAYSDKIKYRACVCGNTVNLHIFVGKNQTKVGSPMIFGSF